MFDLTNEAPADEGFSSDKIRKLLQMDKTKYTVIKNESAKPIASWWKTFGFPAMIDEKNEVKRILGYISCFRCYHTFIYNHSSGTTRFKEHTEKCSTLCSTISSTDPAGATQISSANQSLLSHYGFGASMKLSERDITHFKEISAQWICEEVRPFSLLEDRGFRTIAQELVRIGIVNRLNHVSQFNIYLSRI